MTKDTRYNGWTNYETWNVALWMGNDQGSQKYWDDNAQDAYNFAKPSRFFTKEEQATTDLAALMKEEYENAKAELLEDAKKATSVWADLLGAALSEVNWLEIAKPLIQAAKEVNRA